MTSQTELVHAQPRTVEADTATENQNIVEFRSRSGSCCDISDLVVAVLSSSISRKEGGNLLLVVGNGVGRVSDVMRESCEPAELSNT